MSKEDTEAARAIGVGRLRIISFLGVGSGSAYPTWGQMISLGRDFVTVAWWLATLPGLAILLTVLAINLVGDRLRDALDPRTT
jgi:peptide/nickel transport system permease protein